MLRWFELLTDTLWNPPHFCHLTTSQGSRDFFLCSHLYVLVCFFSSVRNVGKFWGSPLWQPEWTKDCSHNAHGQTCLSSLKAFHNDFSYNRGLILGSKIEHIFRISLIQSHINDHIFCMTGIVMIFILLTLLKASKNKSQIIYLKSTAVNYPGAL